MYKKTYQNKLMKRLTTALLICAGSLYADAYLTFDPGNQTVQLGTIQFSTSYPVFDSSSLPSRDLSRYQEDDDFHPFYNYSYEDRLGNEGELFNTLLLPDTKDFKPYYIGDSIDDDLTPQIVECWPFIPPEAYQPFFIGIDISADGAVVLGFEELSNNYQLRYSDDRLSLSLPLIPFSSLVGPDEIAPAVMVNLLPNGLSGDGSTVIGLHPAGQVFRFRSSAPDSLELLDLGSAQGYIASWAVEQSFNGNEVIGQAQRGDNGKFQAALWNVRGELTILNPLDDSRDSVAKLITPDGSVIAGDVRSSDSERYGVVPFIWSEAKGFQQLGDPDASEEQVIVQTLSDDGLMLGGYRGSFDGQPAINWFWTEENGFQDLIVIICEFDGNTAENYTLTGVNLQRGFFLGNFEDGTEFLSFNGISISPSTWMASIPEPVKTLSSAMGLGAQAMEGAHHRPISQLAIAGKPSFAWFTGDIGKATQERDAKQVSGEVGYGLRLSPNTLLGVAFGYADLEQDFANGGGQSRGAFVVADLGLIHAQGETTLTALLGNNQVTTQRNGSAGETDAATSSVRVRYDAPALLQVGSSAVRPFASVTYDHATMDGYAETGGVAPASFNARSQDTWIGRLGASSKVTLSPTTELTLTLEVAKVLSEDRPDFTGTDVITGLLDFAVPDVRGRDTWGRLGLDFDHQLAADTILSLTLHSSTRGDTFDVAGALSIRKGF